MKHEADPVLDRVLGDLATSHFYGEDFKLLGGPIVYAWLRSGPLVRWPTLAMDDRTEVEVLYVGMSSRGAKRPLTVSHQKMAVQPGDEVLLYAHPSTDAALAAEKTLIETLRPTFNAWPGNIRGFKPCHSCSIAIDVFRDAKRKFCVSCESLERMSPDERRETMAEANAAWDGVRNAVKVDRPNVTEPGLLQTPLFQESKRRLEAHLVARIEKTQSVVLPLVVTDWFLSEVTHSRLAFGVRVA